MERKRRYTFLKKGQKRFVALLLTLVMVLTYVLPNIGTIQAQAGEQSITLGVSTIHFSHSYMSESQVNALKKENPDVSIAKLDISEVLNGETRETKTLYFDGKVSLNDVDISDEYELTNDPIGTSIPAGETTSVQIEIERKARVFEVSFDANGGEGNMDSLSVNEDEGETIPENAFSKEGYTFTGFNTSASGDGTAYQPGDDIQPEEDMTLYAQYKENPKEETDIEEPADDAANVSDDQDSAPAEDVDKDTEESGGQDSTLTGDADKDAAKDDAQPADAKNPDGKKDKADGKESEAEPNSVTDTDDDKTTYYEIRFVDENGGDIVVNESAEGDARYIQYVKAGGSTQAPHRPVINADGNKFVGWFTEADGKGDRVTEFTNIQADATYYAYYTEQPTYKITINYVFENDGKEAAESYVAYVEAGDSYTATVDSPELAGYTADKLSVDINLSDINEDKTYTVKYTGEMQTYYVEHQWESLDDPGTYVTHEKETKQGYIGQYTEAEAKTYDGFIAGAFQNVKITPNTTTDKVTIQIKYTRNNYELIFDTGEGGSYIAAKSVKYGESISKAMLDIGTPTRLGYTFQGWTLADGGAIDNATMPAGDLKVKAQWEANTRADYTIVYWLESLNGGYDYVTQTTGTGSVGSDITAPDLNNWQWDNANIEADGVQRDTSKDAQVTISADGKSVKNVYYNRKTFTIQFYKYEKVGEEPTWWGGTKDIYDWVEDEDLRITAKYGEYIADQWNDRAHAAYEWNTEPNGRTSYTLLANMGAKNIEVYADDRGTGTTITYYIEGLNGQRQVYQTLTAADGVSLTNEDKTPIDGFTFNDWKESTGRFDNDLWLYYTRNSYDISFENCTGVGDASLKYEASLATAKPNDNQVKPPTGVDSDYVFAGWYTSPACEDGTEVKWNSTMPSHNMQVYAKWVAPEYTVSFETNGAGTIDPITVEKYKTIESQIPTPEKEGDEFLGWYLDEDCTEPFIANTQITENITLYAKWKNAFTYSYTIQYVDEAGQPIPGVESTTGTAMADTYVLVEPKDIDGYTAKTGSFTALLDENNKVINVVYTKDATWSFRIRYIDANTRQDIIDSVTREVADNTQQVVVNSPSVLDPDYADAFAGYMLVSDPQVVVTKADATKEKEYTITFEYIQQQQTYVVYHQLQMPDGTYVTMETEQKTGKVGDYVTAAPKTYEGYTCVSTKLERSGVVTANPNATDSSSGLNIYVKYDRENALTVQDYIGKYDGQAHGLTVTGTPVNTDMVKETIQYCTDGQIWTETAPMETNVSTDADGKYTVYTRVVTEVTVGGKTTSYTGTSEMHYIEIQKRDVTITAPDATKVYDGTPLNTWYTTSNYKPATISGDGFVGAEGFNHYVYTADSSIYVGEGKNVIDENATKAALKANTKESNYNFTFVKGTLTVTDRPGDEKFVLNIYPNGKTVTYDGTEQEVSGIETTQWFDNKGVSIGSYNYTVEGVSFGASGTDAGTYEVRQTGTPVIKDAQGNDVTNQFTIHVNLASLIINKRPVTITAGSASFDYDGKEHSLNESSVTSETVLADGHTYTATITGSVKEQNEIADNVISDIRIYDVDKKDVTKNYEITAEKGRLRINAIDAEITAIVQIADKVSMYNGAEQRFSDLSGDNYTVTFNFNNEDDKIDTTGWTIAGTEITTARTNAGTTDVYFAEPANLKVLDADGNPVESAEVSVQFGTLTITKAPLTLTAGSNTKEYDGTPLVSHALDSTEGLQGQDRVVVETIQYTGSQLAPGSSDNEIVKGSVALVNGEGKPVTDNYDITLKKGTLIVTNDKKAERVITVKAKPAGKPYDGTPLANGDFQVTGTFLNGDAVDRAKVQVTGFQTFVGSSKNKVDASSVHIMNGNVDVTEAYTIKTEDADLTVTARPITLTAASASKVYDGTPLTASEVTQTGTLAGTDQFKTEPTATGRQTEVGSSANPVGEVKIVDKETGEDRTDNYAITKTPGTLTVTKAAANQNKVAIESDSLTYDGQSHALKAATSTVTEGTTIYYTTKVDPSASDWSAEMPSFTNVGAHTVYVKAVNDNYEDAYATGVLTITKRQVVITGNNDTFTYNGTTQTVEGYTTDKAAGNKGLLDGHEVSGVTASASSENVGEQIPGTITAANDVKITAGTEDVTANYDIITNAGWITITPLEITVGSESGEQLYTGRAFRVREASVTAGELAEGDTITYNVTGMQTDIGSSQNRFTAIIKDGETTVTNNYSIQYTYGTLTVYGEISYDANGGTGEAPKADRYDRGDTYTVRENMFTRSGYTFTGWNTRADGSGTAYAAGSKITSLNSNLTLYTQWSANADTQYTVETYLEGADGTYPTTPAISVIRTGQTDTTAAVTDADKTAPEGYALDPEAENIFEGTIAGDGSLVLKLYFAKDVKGGGDDGDESDTVPDKYQVVFRYVAKGHGTVTGTTAETRTFTDKDGSYTLPTPIVPNADVKAKADAGYHITGWADEAGEDLGAGIKPDFGKLTYNEDQTFTVTFMENDKVTIRYEAKAHGSVSRDSETVAPATGTAKGSVAKPDAGYHFAGWYLGEEKVSDDLNFVPDRNADGIYEEATYTATFAPDEQTVYTVEYYYTNADGSYPEKATYTATRNGQTDTMVSVTEEDKQPTRNGYILDEAAGNVFEGTIAGDGSLVLKLYFAKDTQGGGEDGDEPDNIPDRYQVVFRYMADDNGTVTGATAETHTFKDEEGNYTLPTPIVPDAKVEAAANAGYHIAGWSDEADKDLGAGSAPAFGKLTYDKDQTFTVAFAEDDDVTIRYEAEAHGSVSRDSETVAPATGTAKGSEATPDAGYHFDGWYLGKDEVGDTADFVPGRNADGIYEEATYTARFAPDEATKYVVEFYYENNGTYPEIADDTSVRTGTTDTVASVTDADKVPARADYVLDPSAGNIFSGNIAGDGSLVLKVYFATDIKGGGEDGDEPDTIPDRYQRIFRYMADDNGNVTGNITEVHTFGNAKDGYTLPTPMKPEAKVEAKANAGYHIDRWEDENALGLGSAAAPEFGILTYNEDQIFTVIFAENDDITIRYEAEEHGSVSRDSETVAPATGTPEGSEATPDAGYHFDGWYLGEEKVSENLNFVPEKNADGIYEEATYTARFAPDEQTLYTVEYYYSDENDTYPEEPTSVAKRNGVTGTTVSVTEEDRQPEEGYMLDETAQNIFEGTIAGDGSLVLKLYFTKDTQGGGEDGNEPDNIPDKYQLIFRYVAGENGSVTGTVAEVHTFKDEAGNYTKPTATVPNAAVEAVPDEAYVIDLWADEDGNVFGSQKTPAIAQAYEKNMTFTVTFKSEELVTGHIYILKSVKDGSQTIESQDTFYAGIYAVDAENKETLTEVVTLKQNGTVKVDVPLGGEDRSEAITYTVKETDEQGNPVDKDVFPYTVTGEASVNLAPGANEGTINIINTLKDSEGYYQEQPTTNNDNTGASDVSDGGIGKSDKGKGGKDKGKGSGSDDKNTGVNRQTRSNKTGDDNPIALYMTLLLAAAAVSGVVIVRRRKDTEQ